MSILKFQMNKEETPKIPYIYDFDMRDLVKTIKLTGPSQKLEINFGGYIPFSPSLAINQQIKDPHRRGAQVHFCEDKEPQMCKKHQD